MVMRALTFRVLLLLVWCLPQPLAAEIVARTDRANVGINESFTLIYESSGNIDSEPDFSALHKDFDILNNSQSSNISIVNGQMSRTQTWTLQLFPKKSGTLKIPAIQFGSDQSPELQITVAKQTNSKSQNDKNIFIDVDVSTRSPYVQQQIVYTVKLYHAVPISNASLSSPEISGVDAVIEKMGDGSNYDTIINGKRFEVFERQFVIFPQSEGQLTINPLRFTATVGGGRRGFFDWDPFSRAGRMVRESSRAIQLTVKPIPNNFNGRHWLPAESLQLTESWSPNPLKFTVGEPVTRNISATVSGLTASQLPELDLLTPETFKQYPDQPDLQDAINQNGVLGKRIETAALIPTQAGRFTLPEIRLAWWDIINDKPAFATVPERVIVVAPPATSSDDTAVVTDTIQPTASTEPVGSSEQASGFWPWLSLLLGLAWLTTVAAWCYSNYRARRLQAMPKHVKPAAPDPTAALKKLQQACSNNDATAAKQALLEWARCHWPAVTSLNAITKHVGPQFAEQIQILSDCLYQSGDTTWQSDALRQQLESWLAEFRAGQNTPTNQPLAALHKI